MSNLDRLLSIPLIVAFITSTLGEYLYGTEFLPAGIFLGEG